VFPAYRSDRLRVSEQEARFAFVEALCSGPLLYSVEVPTSKRYQFAGKSHLSAQTDLSIHDPAGNPMCNVEFKAKGFSPLGKEHFPIYKDLQKLLREPRWGLWFHLLEAVNNSTINDLLSVMAREMERVRDEFSTDIEAPGLTIHICVLKHGFSIQRDVALAGTAGASTSSLGRLDLEVSRSGLVKGNDSSGWAVHARSDRASNHDVQPTG